MDGTHFIIDQLGSNLRDLMAQLQQAREEIERLRSQIKEQVAEEAGMKREDATDAQTV